MPIITGLVVLRMTENNKSMFKARECTDKKFLQNSSLRSTHDCRKATSENEVNDSLINFSALISNVLLSSFHMELPPTFAMKDPKPKPTATGKGGGKRPDLEDNKREDGKKRKKENEKRNLIKNKFPL